MDEFSAKILPKGRYSAKATGPAQFVTSKGGTEGVAVEFEITKGDHAGHRMLWTGYLTDKTIDRTMDSLRYMGWKSDDLLDTMSVGVLLDEVELDCAPEEYEGKLRTRIQWVNKPGLGKLQGALDQTAAKLLAARLKAKAVESRTRLGTPKVTTGGAAEAAAAKAKLEAAKAAAVKAALAAFPDAEVERDWSDEIDPADRDAF